LTATAVNPNAKALEGGRGRSIVACRPSSPNGFARLARFRGLQGKQGLSDGRRIADFAILLSVMAAARGGPERDDVGSAAPLAKQTCPVFDFAATTDARRAKGGT
jgi:hypothetical protein